MAQGYAVFIGLVVIAALCVASWFLAPQGRKPSALAVIADSRHRELLPDVGHHLYGSAAPPD
ncbi:H(+)-transporting V0 sector ATPase subunit e [Fusarium falciforme]|nr:H(+)-transporting V0 sector ATPase subunit e [Fusarium falciforme]